MTDTEHWKDFDDALARVQQKIQPAPLDGRDTNIKTATGNARKYSSLSSVYAVCRGVLAEEQFSVLMFPTMSEGDISVKVMLRRGGLSITESCSFPLHGQIAKGGGSFKLTTIQSAGSAITYAKRYVLCAMLGIVSAEDDDGQAASSSGEDHSDSPLMLQLQATALRVAEALFDGNVDRAEEQIGKLYNGRLDNPLTLQQIRGLIGAGGKMLA